MWPQLDAANVDPLLLKHWLQWNQTIFVCFLNTHMHTKQSNRHKVIAQFTAEELALIYLPFFLSQNKLLHRHLSLIVSWDS